jgi:hypothetical protein
MGNQATDAVFLEAIRITRGADPVGVGIGIGIGVVFESGERGIDSDTDSDPDADRGLPDRL